MSKYVDASTLRDWLEQNRPLTVIDVRADEDRAQWSIPGSIHVNAYEALKAGEPSVLSDIELPSDRPVVTVCNLGRMSARAAEVLADRGFAALSLAGGMKAWSLAWNTAEVTLPKAQIVQVRRTGKGCLSYVVFSGSEALVINASLPPDVYLDLAAEKNSTIRHVLDTHIHADHLRDPASSLKKVAQRSLFPGKTGWLSLTRPLMPTANWSSGMPSSGLFPPQATRWKAPPTSSTARRYLREIRSSSPESDGLTCTPTQPSPQRGLRFFTGP